MGFTEKIRRERNVNIQAAIFSAATCGVAIWLATGAGPVVMTIWSLVAGWMLFGMVRCPVVAYRLHKALNSPFLYLLAVQNEFGKGNALCKEFSSSRHSAYCSQS
jgi:phosphotransferase system  glucose/maltose/N-acetylglucosamine-specific IIC component